MDASKFTDRKTGHLVKVTTLAGPDWAFIPNAVPPSWVFPERLWPLLAEAKSQLVRLDEKGKTVGNPILLLSPLQRREALRSSSLEGTHVSARELLLFELDPNAKPNDAAVSEWREVSNYNESLKHGWNRLKAPDGLPLSLRLIREMHERLMFRVRGGESDLGEFRKTQVHVGSDHRYVPPPPELLDACLKDFELFISDRSESYDPLVHAYLAHYQFEAIHPFRDGNGRVGRSLLSLMTAVWAGLDLPWLYMSAYFERYKDEYIDNLFRISTHGDWDRWVEFCLRGTVEQCKDALDRCNKLDALRRMLKKRTAPLAARMPTIIDGLFQTPLFTVANVVKWGATSAPTARKHIQKLIDAGIVGHLEGQRPKVYIAYPVLRIVYEDFVGSAPDDSAETPA